MMTSPYKDNSNPCLYSSAKGWEGFNPNWQRREGAKVRGRASGKSQNPTVLLFALNLACRLELKQKGKAYIVENQHSAGQCTCSSIPTASALSLSLGSQSTHLRRLSIHSHPTQAHPFQHMNQLPACLWKSGPSMPYPLFLSTHSSTCSDHQETTAPLLLPVPHLHPLLLHRLFLWSHEYLLVLPSPIPSRFLFSLPDFREELSIPNPFISPQCIWLSVPYILVSDTVTSRKLLSYESLGLFQLQTQAYAIPWLFLDLCI